MIDLHAFGTPNGHKISIALEELALPYRVFSVHIGKGEQFAPDFLKISPNNRIPAIADIAAFPWVARADRFDVDFSNYPNVNRWKDAIGARPAVVRGLEVPLDAQSREVLFGAKQFERR